MFANISAAYVALHASTKVIRMIPRACDLQSLHGSTFGCPSFPASLPAHPVPMTAAWKLEDFQAELAHLEELHKIRPDSQILQNMANTVCKRIQAIDVWTAHGVLGLTSKAEALQVPAAIKAQLTEAIEASCAQQGTSHLKLTNAGQVVQDITPYLTKDDWTKLESSMSQQDCMVILAKRLVAMGLTGLKEQTSHQAIGLLRYLGHLANRPDLSPSQANQAVKDFVACSSPAMLQTLDHSSKKPSWPRQMVAL